MMNELVRNQCDVTNHQVNVRFLLQLQPELQRFLTLVKQSQELKTVAHHKLYDILKQHQNEVNDIRAERLARTANLLALVAQQQPVYHPQNHPITTLKIPQPDHNQLLLETDEKEIYKLMALIFLSFKKIYKPTNNNLRNSSNTSRENQDNTLSINRATREHHEQPESVNDTYLEEQGDTNITIDSLDMSTNGETIDQDDDDFAKERDLLASLIEKL
nr:hypothetical protein [Tanacetum cinerariifolium]